MSPRYVYRTPSASVSPPAPDYPDADSPFELNTSASSSYNAAGISANFDVGETHDKSHNVQASNVSGESVHDLLYPGHITKVYAVTTDWWKVPPLTNHISNGLTSNDATQAQKQIAEMARRGLDGMVASWYGSDNHDAGSTTATTINAANLKLLAECESQGLEFICMFVKLPTSPSSGGTQDMKDEINYLNTNYWPSSAYLKISSRPVFLIFDEYSGVDWSAVRTYATSHGNPWFLFRNSSGFSHAQSDGAFAWLGASQPPGTTTDYLDSFYQAGLASGGKKYFGSIYKGMDQTLASWSEGRFIEQQNGQTLLDTIARIPANGFGTSQQLKYLLWATWNDYEEGTEIETGIDSGIEISASYSDPTLSWTIDAGNENVIKQYDILETQDDATFRLLGTVLVGDPYSFTVPELESGDHDLYVVGRGKCSIVTPVSAAVTVSV